MHAHMHQAHTLVQSFTHPGACLRLQLAHALARPAACARTHHRCPASLTCVSTHCRSRPRRHARRQVTKVCHASHLDAQRLKLVVDQRGIVLAAPCASPRALFGFEPASVIGKPLAAFVNVFEAFRVAQARQRGAAGAGSRSGGGSLGSSVFGAGSRAPSLGPAFSLVARKLQAEEPRGPSAGGGSGGSDAAELAAAQAIDRKSVV